MRRTIIALIGSRANHAPDYRPSDWHERDNFTTEEAARSYAGTLSRLYRRTPYRVTATPARRRYFVEYVPEWRLRS